MKKVDYSKSTACDPPIILNKKEWDRLEKFLDNPPKPTQYLIDSVKRYKKLVINK